MAVIAELLHRKCNTAIPSIDVGTDVFAFRDDREEVARIQVKTDTGTYYEKGDGWSAKFGVPMKQLKRADSPPLFYTMVVRLDDRWENFLIISRASLKELWNDGPGSENGKSGDLVLHIQFRFENEEADAGAEPKLTAKCGNPKTKVFDLTKYLNAWNSLPPLQPVAPIEAADPLPNGPVAAIDPAPPQM